MSPIELFLLGRTLMKIGEMALPTDGVPEYALSVRTVMVVLADVLEHPQSSASDVVQRTGLPQSAVSGAIARLKATGSLKVMADPLDARRQVLSASKKAAGKKVVNATIDDALAMAMHNPPPRELKSLIKSLEKLSERLRKDSKKQAKGRPVKA